MAASHPTIIIGFGQYGRAVLEALLASAATRGVLAWEDAAGGASRAARRLKDLTLLTVPFPPGVEDETLEALIPPAAGSPEILEDLDRQIGRVDVAADGALATALREAKSHLLSAALIGPDRERMRLGLDVIVLAQPRTRSMLGVIAEMIEPGLDELANDATLQRSIQGHDLLNIIGILDFENYWDRSAPAAALRRAVRDSVERLTRRRPGLGRVYLVDGRTPDGSRTAQLRLDESVLFLEFLLFEGQRATPDLQSLYQRERDDAPPIGSVGIRLFERSTGRLSRIAAAYFGQGWLEHMASDTAAPDTGARRELAEVLDRYGPGRLYSEAERERFRAVAERAVREMETELLDLDPNLADWPARVRRSIDGGLQRLRRRLTVDMAERARQLQEDKLRGLHGHLVDAVSAALHHFSAPQPVGAVIRELKRLASEALGSEAEAFERPARPAEAERPTDLSADLEVAHRRYLTFRDAQVDPRQSRRWWPLLAAVTAAGLAPVAVDALAGFAPADPAAPHWWRVLVEASEWPGTPPLAAAVVFAAGWLVGRRGLQRRLQARVDRGLRFFTHPERGRLADAVRAALDEGPVRGTALSLADDAYHELARRLRSAVRSEVERILKLLEERRKEMRWLRDQLRSYLRTQDIDPDGSAVDIKATGVSSSVFRHAIDRDEDLHVMLARNPPDPDRYRSTQSQLDPFASWDERFSDAFLYPVGFLDTLSALYRDIRREVLDTTDRESQALGLARALGGRHVHDFHTAFYWPAGMAGGDASRRYSILPDEWREHDDVLRQLKDHAYDRILPGVNPERAYLLRVQLGVEAHQLEAAW